MNRQILTIWIAGLMIGSGSGLIIARSLPGSHHVNSNEIPAQSNVQPGENRSFSPDFLADPQQFPSPESQINKFIPHKISSTENRQPEQQTFEPRLLPEGEASPVQSQEPQITVKKPTSSEFQDELKEIAPEFTEKALDDLAKIRSQIEGDNPAKKNKP